jgi:hypothetical protein
MGNLSEHFNNQDFACTCGQCRNEYSISLTLVGILEDVACKFALQPTITRGYVCDTNEIKEIGPKKNYHGNGKAVDFTVPKEKIAEVFRYLETFPEISGLGLDPQAGSIHVDLRDKEPVTWIVHRGEQDAITPELREQYGLGESVKKDQIPASLTIELPLEV